MLILHHWLSATQPFFSTLPLFFAFSFWPLIFLSLLRMTSTLFSVTLLLLLSATISRQTILRLWLYPFPHHQFFSTHALFRAPTYISKPSAGQAFTKLTVNSTIFTFLNTFAQIFAHFVLHFCHLSYLAQCTLSPYYSCSRSHLRFSSRSYLLFHSRSYTISIAPVSPSFAHTPTPAFSYVLTALLLKLLFRSHPRL